MPITQDKLIKSPAVPAAIDRALNALATLRATYTSNRSDLDGSNQRGDVAYVNFAQDCLIISRQLQHDALKAAADVIGQPVSTFDIPDVMIFEGPEFDILGEFREMLDAPETCIASQRRLRNPPSTNNNNLIVRNGSVQ